MSAHLLSALLMTLAAVLLALGWRRRRSQPGQAAPAGVLLAAASIATIAAALDWFFLFKPF